MVDLKTAIFDEVKSHSNTSTNLDFNQMDELLFKHRNSLRLNKLGFTVLKDIFKSYSFTLPDNLKSKHMIALSKLQYPYYLTDKKLVLFSEQESIYAELTGDMIQFLETILKI